MTDWTRSLVKLNFGYIEASSTCQNAGSPGKIVNLLLYFGVYGLGNSFLQQFIVFLIWDRVQHPTSHHFASKPSGPLFFARGEKSRGGLVLSGVEPWFGMVKCLFLKGTGGGDMNFHYCV